MKRLPTIIFAPKQPDVRLRLAEERDRELMRTWKNANKQFFFLKADITPEQQREWFAGYLQRPDDHNYMVEERVGDAWTTVGVLACRLRDGDVDVYNVMRGARTEADRANMGEALRLLCATIRGHYRERISCKVLSDNPATAWYLRHGFKVTEEHGDHRLLVFQERSDS